LDTDHLLLSQELLVLGIFNSAGAIVLVLLLLAGSALISASEVALFSLTPAQKADLKVAGDPASKNIVRLLEEPDRERGPKRLLATILIANNAVNIAFVLVASTIIREATSVFVMETWVRFVLDVAVITFIMLMFGEIIPKVFATGNNLVVSRFMSTPLLIIQRIVHPISWLLLGLGSLIEKVIGERSAANISVDDLGHALQLTSESEVSQGEQKILEGIVTFGAKEASQIMTPRLDIAALQQDEPFSAVLASVVDRGYSRWPVYDTSLDAITGFLFVKDLLPYIDDSQFRWQPLVRPAFFVSEHKKIDDLLQEFQKQKIHLAIVVDEYGGTSGLITLEDILEEIVGDISDEFDDEEHRYSKLDDHNYIFEGKISLVDVYRILGIDDQPFENKRGDSSTLAGFVIEQAGQIPDKGDSIGFEGYTFTIEAADKRRIKRIKVSLPQAAVTE